MRISDWSSDVCSSDLHTITASLCHGNICSINVLDYKPSIDSVVNYATTRRLAPEPAFLHNTNKPLTRSEEHTSELQSLMRISYVVFCLKKKKSTNLLRFVSKHTHRLHLPTHSSGQPRW